MSTLTSTTTFSPSKGNKLVAQGLSLLAARKLGTVPLKRYGKLQPSKDLGGQTKSEPRQP